MDESINESQSFHLVAEGLEGEEGDVNTSCALDVVASHDQSFGNYSWLHPYYGKVLWIDFEEPIGSGAWRTYDRYWFSRHAAAINHDPKVLYEEHIREFVDPKTKSINLLFWFQRPNGTVYSMPPNKHFYKLEAEYFRRWNLCDENAPLPEYTEKRGPEPLYCQGYGEEGEEENEEE